MSTKENLAHMTYHVKPEPRDSELPPLNPFNRDTHSGHASSAVKAEPNEPRNAMRHEAKPGLKGEDASMKDAEPAQPLKIRYTKYDSVADIAYTPEGALKEGVKMIQTLQERINTLRLGSKMREEVWKREIDNLKSQSTPTTLIAVCGATGAGKSSVMNALLDDNIVPTSGMRACTAVVTEIAYHNKPTINGEVSFLSEAQWHQEMAVLLTDLVDEDGRPKRTTDLKSDAGVAWQKMHAVYPKLAVDEVIKMTADDLIAYDPSVRQILGTTKKIVARDSKQFGKEMARYIDSKDQKRGDKKDKNKEKEKPKESVMDKVRKAAGAQTAQIRGTAPAGSNRSDADAPAMWPLIKQVTVRCPAKALSTGAILVDLPGVADANAARNNIAKDYMKKANCIWILAPITRAVDDKTAKDLLGDAFKMQLMNGNYDDHCITFIASKCDDISCSEVIGALNLYDEPELLEMEDRIDALDESIKEQKAKKTGAEKEIKSLEAEVKDLKARLEDHKSHLEAVENGESYTSKFAGKKASSKKRKRGGKEKSRKRQRSAASGSDNSDFDFSEEEEESGSGSDSDSDDEKSGSDGESADEVADDLVEEETEDSLNAKIESIEVTIKALRARMKEPKAHKREASDQISILQKDLSKVQKEKNAFCSRKRSEFSRDVLKEDFRTGLKELDDAAAEERDPDNFDPSINLRDYKAIDLPVFTVSSRDYVRVKGQVKGDGEPTTFTNVQDTGIPELQGWCHTLTVASRQRAANQFMKHLEVFAKGVQNYVQGIGDVTAIDREELRQKWESQGFNNEPEPANPWETDDPLQDILGRLGGNLYTMDEPRTKRDTEGQVTGVTPRLCLEFSELVDECIEGLKAKFKDGLEEKCRSGAAAAGAAAVPLVDEFGASIHWGTYRATMRRYGCWRRDLNVELINPFTRSIARSWGDMFESDLFGQFERSTLETINKLLQEVEESAAPGLKDRAKLQGEACLEEARTALQKTMATVKETLATQQKETSRLLAPHVQAQLHDAYDETLTFRGTGSVARQKAFFRQHIDDNKDEIFEGGADTLLGRLDEAAGAIGEALDNALGDLAQKIEVNISVLWEGVRDDPSQVRARASVVDIVSEVQKQVQLWLEAAALKKDAELAAAMDGVDSDGDVEMN